MQGRKVEMNEETEKGRIRISNVWNERDREREKCLDNVDRMTNEIKKREKFEFEFGLKIEREMTRCISWINGNIQAKGGSMFVDVDENLKREKNICSRFEDKRGNTNTIIHEYTDVVKVVKETKSRLFFPLKGWTDWQTEKITEQTQCLVGNQNFACNHYSMFS